MKIRHNYQNANRICMIFSLL